MTGTVPPVVDRAWVSEHAAEIVLADVRWYLDGRSGRAAYDAGHLPNAVFVDLDADLAAPHPPAPSSAGRHPLPAPDAFAAAMARLGIGDDDIVVAYDDDGGVVAARLVWMLRATDHPAALLDGGLRPGDELTTAVPERRAPGPFSSRPWPADRVAAIEDAAGAAGILLDARDPARYRGDVEPVDARPGHVPGARTLPARQNLTADGRILPVPELRRRFAAVGIAGPGSAEGVISMCGSGVTACHTLLLLEHAGLGAGRLFPGSWSAYSSDPGRPAALGDDPG